MSASLEDRIIKLEKTLGGRVSAEFIPDPLKESKISPLATICVCRPNSIYRQEHYLTTTENINRKRWANIPSPYFVIVEYFGEQQGLSNVMKITVSDRELNSHHIYSPDLDELIYNDNLIQDYFGKHLLLKRHVNLTKIYQELTNIGINVDTVNNYDSIKNSTK